MATDYLALARECGFDAAVPLDVSTLRFLPEVRDACAAGRCNSYGHNWACPPACGTLEEIQKQIEGFSTGMVLQAIGGREDSYDFEAMMEVEKRCKTAFYSLIDALHAQGAVIFPMSAGTCTRCKTCTYPDAPCRFPESLFPSMEASGLFVSEVCKKNNLPYYYGDDKIAFTCCILIK